MSSESQDLLARLKAFEGRAVGEPFVARDPVNQAMIRHWCDAMGDENPVYTDPAAAGASVHGGVVAPPTMLQAWSMRGLKPPPQTGPNAQAELWKIFDEAGYTSIVAVNCDQEYQRYLRPGDQITHSVIIETISEMKKTALGEGFFISQLHTFADGSGDTVGTMRFRLFKFKPGTGAGAARKKAEKSAEETAAKSGSPKSRFRRTGTEDTRFFWEGLRAKKLLIPRCKSCGRFRFPPEPMCHHCNSLEWEPVEACGRGTLFSFVHVHHPPIPGFERPNPVGLIELEEGVRIVSNIQGAAREDIHIGMPLELGFEVVDDEFTIHHFKPGAGA